MSRRSAREIRRRNLFEVLRCIYGADRPVSRAQIREATDLSFATVASLTGMLLNAGVLLEAEHEDSGGGRPRALLAINADRGLLVGVDLAESCAHIRLFDLAMTEVAATDAPLDPEHLTPERAVTLLAAELERMLAEAGRGAGEILGVGVAVPGLVERRDGVAVFSPYWSWRDVPLRSLLERRLKLPLHLDNPLKASVVAELWFGAGRSRSELAVVTLREGVGAGLAVDGALYRGANDCAGEWGHTCLVLGGRDCRCGRRGCVETYVSTGGIARTLTELGPAAASVLGETPTDDPAAVVAALARAADANDPTALQVLDTTAEYLGVALANLISMLDPEAVVLESHVATTLGAHLLDRVRAVAARQLMAHTMQHTEIELSPIADSPVARGAAAFALEDLIDRVQTAPTARPGTTPEEGRTRPDRRRPPE